MTREGSVRRSARRLTAGGRETLEETVAEEVGAMDELDLVKQRGADLVQGYIYSQALPQEEVLA